MSLQEQAVELREQGQRKNAEVRALAEENQRNISRFRDSMSKATEAKHKRDALNAQVKDLLIKRRQLVEMSRELDAKLKAKEEEFAKMPEEGRYSAPQLRRMIKAMEWKLQTEALSPRYEKELSQEIAKLEKELAKVEKREPLLRELRELRRQRHDLSLEFRALDKTLEMSRTESDQLHQGVLKSYQQADEAKAKISEYLAMIGEKSKEADEVFDKLRDTREELDREEKQRVKEREQKRKRDESEKQMTLDERARKIYGEFKSGKKISLEDLQVLQASGIEI